MIHAWHFIWPALYTSHSFLQLSMLPKLWKLCCSNWAAHGPPCHCLIKRRKWAVAAGRAQRGGFKDSCLWGTPWRYSEQLRLHASSSEGNMGSIPSQGSKIPLHSINTRLSKRGSFQHFRQQLKTEALKVSCKAGKGNLERLWTELADSLGGVRTWSTECLLRRNGQSRRLATQPCGSPSSPP